MVANLIGKVCCPGGGRSHRRWVWGKWEQPPKSRKAGFEPQNPLLRGVGAGLARHRPSGTSSLKCVHMISSSTLETKCTQNTDVCEMERELTRTEQLTVALREALGGP